MSLFLGTAFLDGRGFNPDEARKGLINQDLEGEKTVARALTTGEFAKLCSVRTETVSRWIHNGSLKAHSTPGGRFRIPSDAAIDFMTEHDIPIPPELEGERAHRVLVVDDEKTIREVVIQALKRLDSELQIEEAEDGVEGCIKLGGFSPDLLVLDLMMPKADGYAVIEQVRSDANLRNTRILVLTGYPSPENIDRAMQAGADDWLAKPFNIPEFGEKVKALLARKVKVYR
ncbi:MAG: Chemotaxis response regulator protein-glutamate methylesterase [bacterium]|nr:Chemotaxis response regulator protein-glutamate methylesterase [bacterium]